MPVPSTPSSITISGSVLLLGHGFPFSICWDRPILPDKPSFLQHIFLYFHVTLSPVTPVVHFVMIRFISSFFADEWTGRYPARVLTNLTESRARCRRHGRSWSCCGLCWPSLREKRTFPVASSISCTQAPSLELHHLYVPVFPSKVLSPVCDTPTEGLHSPEPIRPSFVDHWRQVLLRALPRWLRCFVQTYRWYLWLFWPILPVGSGPFQRWAKCCCFDCCLWWRCPTAVPIRLAENDTHWHSVNAAKYQFLFLT